MSESWKIARASVLNLQLTEIRKNEGSLCKLESVF